MLADDHISNLGYLWSDHQVMVLILLRGTFGVGLQGAPGLMHFMMDPSLSNNDGDSDKIVT